MFRKFCLNRAIKWKEVTHYQRPLIRSMLTSNNRYSTASFDPKLTLSKTDNLISIQPLDNGTNLPKQIISSNNLKFSDINNHNNKEEDLEVASHLTDFDLSQAKMIPETIRKNLISGFNFKLATKVQKEVIQTMPLNQSLMVQASTGSGKTLAYLIPAIDIMMKTLSPEQMDKGKQCSILILAPTRELVVQISKDAKRLLRSTPFSTMTFIGGTAKKEDLNRISNKRVDLIIATPGRVVDLLSSSKIFRAQVEDLKVLILDEADELMNLGFAQNVLTVHKNLPITKLTLLFSATLSSSLDNTLIKKLLSPRYPSKTILVEETKSAEPTTALNINPNISHKACVVSLVFQPKLIYAILDKYKDKKILLFLPTVASVEVIAGLLRSLKFNVLEMHSILDQNTRTKVADSFREMKQGILITTDISSRGMDYPDVGLVLQWGSPSNVESYFHRVGRTGRAGNVGDAIMVLSPFEEKIIKRIDKAGITIGLIDTENDIPKPKSRKIHEINLSFDKIKPGIMKQFFRSNLTYYLTICNMLSISRRQINSQVRGMVEALGHIAPTVNGERLPKHIQDKLDEVDRAKLMVVKRRKPKTT